MGTRWGTAMPCQSIAIRASLGFEETSYGQWRPSSRICVLNLAGPVELYCLSYARGAHAECEQAIELDAAPCLASLHTFLWDGFRRGRAGQSEQWCCWIGRSWIVSGPAEIAAIACLQRSTNA